MEETLKLKLYSPLTAELETQADYDAYYDEPDLEQLRGGDLIYYQDAILEGIAQEEAQHHVKTSNSNNC